MNTIASLVIIIGVGVIVFSVGIIIFFRQRAKLNQFSRAEGTVIELIPVSVGHPTFVVSKTETGVRIDPKYRYRPRVRFTTDSGQALDLISRVASRPPRYKIGEKVGVLYSPHNPSNAQINSSLEMWFATAMLMGGGVFAIVMGLLGWLLSTLFA